MPSYISTNIDELVDQAPDNILDILAGDDIPQTTVILSSNYGIPVGKQELLSDIITYILIGALQPEDVVKAIVEMLELSEEEAIHLAEDLEQSILEKARVSVVKKEGDIKKLEFQGERTKEELRAEIMDTTKRESGINKSQAAKDAKKTTVITPGSRSQLMEQLQVIGSIPDDEEISERLKHIQEQIASIKKVEEDNSLESNIALKSFMFGDKGKETVSPTNRPATYSVAPKEYNVDPYREIADN